MIWKFEIIIHLQFKALLPLVSFNSSFLIDPKICIILSVYSHITIINLWLLIWYSRWCSVLNIGSTETTSPTGTCITKIDFLIVYWLLISIMLFHSVLLQCNLQSITLFNIWDIKVNFPSLLLSQRWLINGR